MNLEIIKKYFIPQTILDIGANTGQFYNECNKVFNNAEYFLIEGNSYCGKALEKLGVEYKITLLSNIKKNVNFYIRKSELLCTGNSIYREKTDFFNDDDIIIEIRETQTLNDLFTNRTFDLIKLDTQGSEMDIIIGGLDVIKRSKGVIVEVSDIEYNKNAPLFDEVNKFMNSIGFLDKEIIGNNFHPITHQHIQRDILYINKEFYEDNKNK